MTQEQMSVKQWMSAFGQETPEKPTIPSLEVRKLRAKLILEEALETIQGLGISAYTHDNENEWCSIHDLHWDFHEVDTWKPSLELIADGCEDLKVVTEGCLVACGLIDYKNYRGPFSIHNVDPLFDEVMRSNNSKMWNSEDFEKLYLTPADLPEGWTVKIVNEHPEVEGVYALLVKNQDGKVIKSPSYSPANLQPIIDEMSK